MIAPCTKSLKTTHSTAGFAACVIVMQRRRIRRLSLGNPGQFRPLKSGINELKVDYGPGYRVYCKFKGKP